MVTFWLYCSHINILYLVITCISILKAQAQSLLTSHVNSGFTKHRLIESLNCESLRDWYPKCLFSY